MNHSKRIGSRLLSLLLAVALVLALSVPAFAAQDSRSSADTGTLKIAVMLIAVNFALNLLGCYVHDLRLQCLEFFKNFYQDGGKPFRPLAVDTKYVDIQKD